MLEAKREKRLSLKLISNNIAKAALMFNSSLFPRRIFFFQFQHYEKKVLYITWVLNWLFFKNKWLVLFRFKYQEYFFFHSDRFTYKLCIFHFTIWLVSNFKFHYSEMDFAKHILFMFSGFNIKIWTLTAEKNNIAQLLWNVGKKVVKQNCNFVTVFIGDNKWELAKEGKQYFSFVKKSKLFIAQL